MSTRFVVAFLTGVMLFGCASGPPAGSPAPGFAATTMSGDEVSLAALRGHVVILDFWAVW